MDEEMDEDDVYDKYFELLYAVKHKIPGETRHQTVLRYIKACENSHNCKTAQEAGGEA